MRHLNYGHLLYFHTVVTEGSVARAAEKLHLTPQTVSGQIKLLEDVIGEPLFQRAGRSLVPSATGRLVHSYTERIFGVGAELASRLREPGSKGPESLRVGIVDAVSKLVACRVIAPVLADRNVRLVCTEGALETLLGELSVHALDLVLSDRPVPSGLGVRAWNHPLGDSGIAFYALPALAEPMVGDFPHCLDGAPMLLPIATHALRRRLDHWFDEQGVQPRVVAEFDDSALMKTFGGAGLGVFPAPAMLGAEILRTVQSIPVGSADGVSEQCIAIAPERRLRHPVVLDLVAESRAMFESEA